MKLPLSTRIIIATSSLFREHGILLFCISIGIFFALWFVLSRVRWIRLRVDRILLKTPIIGSVITNYTLAHSMRTTGLLLKSGIPIGKALALTAETTPHLLYQKAFTEMARRINRGEKMSTYCSALRRLFPSMVAQIIAVGERSSSLDRLLIYLSELYEAEVDNFSKNLSTTIEPVLMIVMGIIVGFIAISIITPIYSITQNLHG